MPHPLTRPATGKNNGTARSRPSPTVCPSPNRPAADAREKEVPVKRDDSLVLGPEEEPPGVDGKAPGGTGVPATA